MYCTAQVDNSQSHDYLRICRLGRVPHRVTCVDRARINVHQGPLPETSSCKGNIHASCGFKCLKVPSQLASYIVPLVQETLPYMGSVKAIQESRLSTDLAEH